ncbi:hypothetical protein [Qipengyuania sp.]|uniref:hypothetical protein n=1 Tax=Qipengyuania sp. TaxID=2004515 RepID=UPI0035C79201
MTGTVSASQTIALPPARGWTAEAKVQFLDRLATHGNARAACRAVGLSAESAYRLRRRDAQFARAWNAAVLLGRDNSVELLSERAIEGVEEDIYFRGELVGTRRRYDSRLLLAHLARLDKLADDTDASVREWAGHFDAVLAAIASGESDIDAVDREGYAEEMARDAVEVMTRVQTDAFYAGRRENEDEDEDEETGAYTATERDEALSAFHEDLDADCAVMDSEVRKIAASRWDANLAKVEALIDGFDRSPARNRPAPEKNAPPAPSFPHVSSARSGGNPATPPAPATGAKSFPCTASTASTMALALGLAGGVRPEIRTRKSPFGERNVRGRR